MDQDVHMQDVQDVSSTPGDGSKARNFIVAIDFGTTFSSVAYVGYYHASQLKRLTSQHIEVVEKYPDNPFLNFPCYDVPTEIWYSTDGIKMCNTSKKFATVLPINYDSSSDTDDEDDEDDEFNQTNGATPKKPLPYTCSSRSSSSSPNSTSPHSICWGYGVHEQLKKPGTDSSDSKRLCRFKLLLDSTDETKVVRGRLSESCTTLQKMQLIDDETHIIADYLEQLLRHTRERLKDSEGHRDNSNTEFVLGVPVIWKSWALRQMQAAMTIAVRQSGFVKPETTALSNLFLISEPEAAATFVLESENTRIKVGETFVVVDAGGGTVDACTYTVRKDTPIRLESEIVDPGGAMCGSSFINERFQALLIQRLRFAPYLEGNGQTISKIIDGLVVKFESRYKSKYDSMLSLGSRRYELKVSGLKENEEHRFIDGAMQLGRREVGKLFQPSLEGVAHVMMEQIQKARGVGHKVQKVILIGGFGQSCMLSAHLKHVLSQYNAEKQEEQDEVELIVSKRQSSAVARGAVLRALRKEHGPARILQSSYGFLRGELYGQFDAHTVQTPERGVVDGKKYLLNTIDWLIHKGDFMPSEDSVKRRVEHLFAFEEEKFLCTETLYVSDNRHESHYQYDHPHNEGATPVCELSVDMSFLRDNPKCIEYRERTRRGKKVQVPFWRVSFTLILIISGRSLRYEARHPDENGDTLGVAQIPIAAAFRPGTE